ncbi:hypothetical protein [Tropicibacter oceani]|uniref:Uncharacterized protein n=1 Tax=Tropicibacter oceani TaxID=3058420 RepID=A0ABY8QK07_9RHOB|nr:hypothetical protein [Tropicibacter oceani]WGW04323.1 hypothetical protein QF118_01930 [Tropicibacter oceani]
MWRTRSRLINRVAARPLIVWQPASNPANVAAKGCPAPQFRPILYLLVGANDPEQNMRILIFVLALASQSLSLAGVPSTINEGAVFSGSDRMAHDESEKSKDDKKKDKTWIRRKRTVIA